MNELNKREKLLNASLAVTMDKGYRNLRISDITERAGVGKGTFYTYFSNKEDCFRQASDNIGRVLWETYIKSNMIKSIEDISVAAEQLFCSIWKTRILGRLYACEMLEADKQFNKAFTSINKNLYKEIVKIVNKDEPEEILEIKAFMIMGIIDALIFEVFICDCDDENLAKTRFVRAFIGIINAKL